MHALGFYHEHQRPDRGDFVRVDETKMTSNCFNAFKTNIKTSTFKQISQSKNQGYILRKTDSDEFLKACFQLC